MKSTRIIPLPPPPITISYDGDKSLKDESERIIEIGMRTMMDMVREHLPSCNVIFNIKMEMEKL